MIKQIIRISSLPIQAIFDSISRYRNAKKMMCYCLKIKPNIQCAAYKNMTNNNHKKITSLGQSENLLADFSIKKSVDDGKKIYTVNIFSMQNK